MKRAEDEQRTRARIVDAAEALHGTVGPAHATISAIAERADVTRATVYRHFPDDESLFLACSGQWLSRQRLPDPGAWEPTTIPGPAAAGLADIYRYYRDGEPMLTSSSETCDVVPALVRGPARARGALAGGRLTRSPGGGATPSGGGRARHIVRHLAVAVRGPAAVRRGAAPT